MISTDIDAIIKILRREVAHYKVPVVDLIQVQTKDPFKVLVATILSARTKDETTAVVCKRLFDRVEKIEDLEHVSEAELRDLIYPVGFYKTKAKHLKELPAVMKEEFDGEVPHEIDDLLKLPGVGRKTANLVRAVAFDKPAICVDVHVMRISNRLGYVKAKTPHETEIALRKKLPEKYWTTFNTLLVAFGQNICRPVSPKCSECPINAYCKKVGVTSQR